MINLAKAIQYAEKFASKDKARPLFTYILVKDGGVISCDTHFAIKCEVGGKQEPQLINPRGTELLAEPEKYPDVNKFFQIKGFKTNITFDSDTGLKESFKKLAVIFDTCKKLTTKKELHKVYMKINSLLPLNIQCQNLWESLSAVLSMLIIFQGYAKSLQMLIQVPLICISLKVALF